MWLESEVGRGSTFHFRLPITPPAGPVARPERWLAEGWVWTERTQRSTPPTLPQRPRLLVCDDGGALEPLLGRYGDEAELVAVADLAQAAAELQRCPAQALILNSPSPAALCAQLAEAAAVVPDTPVIGSCAPPRLERVTAAGAVDFVTKPVTCERLQQAVTDLRRPVRRVLLVEDDAEARDLFTRMLRTLEPAPEVRTAATGVEALAAMREAAPDLLLLDIVLPDMDGWRLLSIKGEDASLRDVPAIIVSGQDPQDEPPATRVLMATLGQGVPLGRLLPFARAVSALLLAPE